MAKPGITVEQNVDIRLVNYIFKCAERIGLNAKLRITTPLSVSVTTESTTPSIQGGEILELTQGND
jgi:hypothetical protein